MVRRSGRDNPNFPGTDAAGMPVGPQNLTDLAGRRGSGDSLDRLVASREMARVIARMLWQHERREVEQRQAAKVAARNTEPDSCPQENTPPE